METSYSTYSQKVSPIIGVIRRGPRMSDGICKQFLDAHILSKIRPNLIVWSTGSDGNKRQIQVLMNRAVKALYRLNWFTSLSHIIEQYGLFTIDELIRIDRSKFVYKVVKGLIKCNLELDTMEKIAGRNTRNKHTIYTLPSKTNNLRKGVFNAAIDEYNKLPKNIVLSSTSIENFINKLKFYIRSSR